jgi:hypothetical protein
MSSPGTNKGFLSSLGVEHTTVALIGAMMIIVFLFLNVVGKDQPLETKPTVLQTSSPSGDIGGLNP